MAEALGEKAPGKYGVLNLGIGGNCVVRGGLSEPAVKRFDRDILGQSGVTAVVVFEGINDIGGSDGRSEQIARDMIEAFKGFIQKVHAQGKKIYFGTITPFGNCFYDKGNFFKEAARQTVNQWIRTNKEADGFIDFDEALRDPANPRLLKAPLQEDWLHLNAAGYREMGKYAAQYFLNK